MTNSFRRHLKLQNLLLLLLCLALATPEKLWAQPGTKLWEFAVGDPILAAPAIGTNGTIYVGSYDRKLYAITPVGGSNWSFSLPSAGFTGIYSSPAIGSDGAIYFGGEDGTLYALNPTNGTSQWTFSTGTSIYSSPAVGSDGTVYFGSYKVQNNDHPYLYAVTNGTQRWRYEPADSIFSHPVIALDGTIYFGCDDGKLYALNANGTLRWTFNTGIKAITASPAIGADGKVYIGVGSILNPRLYCVNTNGTTNWVYTAGSRIRSSAAIGDDGTIYFGCDDKKLYALNPNGTLKWAVTNGAAVGSSPAIAADGTIYVGCDDQKLYAFDSSGSNLWTFQALTNVFSSPVIAADGSVYIGAGSSGGTTGKLYAISGTSDLARTPWPMFRHDIRHTARFITVTNTLPVISSIANQTIEEDATLGPLAFTVSDAETPSGNLIVSGSSSNTALVSNGQIQLSGTISNRFVTITPTTNQFGTTLITLTVTDAAGTSNNASFLLSVEAVNDPPVAISDSYSMDEDTTLNIPAPGVLSNDTDVDGDSLAAVLLTSVSHGTLTLSNNGGFTYRAATNYHGSDSFTYRSSDGADNWELATVTLTVNPVNDAPALTPAANRTIDQETTLTITNTASDVDQPAQALTFSLVSAPANAAINPATGVFTWTPLGESSPITNAITVAVTDGGSPPLSNTQSFAIIVVPRPHIETFVHSNDTVMLQWRSVPGQTYRVQYKTNLQDAVWLDLDGDLTADSEIATGSHLVGTAAQRRFYRVQLLLP